jgi:hypothetical protein
MSNRLFWFCPENDIALGRNCSRFTPPRQAALLARYGALLMWWMGDADDYVLIPSDMSANELEQLQLWHEQVAKRFGAGPKLVPSLSNVSVDCIVPWGWSEYAVDCLKHRGCENVMELFGGSISDIRRLSHRRSATLINNELCGAVNWAKYGMPCPIPAIEANTFNAVLSALSGGAYKRWVLKSPWSSSGRGVFTVDGGDVANAKLQERCRSILNEQGSVMIEPMHNKVVDFAMLFEARVDGRVTQLGLSRFFNNRGAAYGGNLIAPDDDIMRELTAYLPENLLAQVGNALSQILSSLISGCYVGPLGVDMMIVRHMVAGEQCFYLVPCVELNLRMTMGVVAHKLAEHSEMIGMQMKVLPAAMLTGRKPTDVVELVPSNPHFEIVATL